MLEVSRPSSGVVFAAEFVSRWAMWGPCGGSVPMEESSECFVVPTYIFRFLSGEKFDFAPFIP